MKTSATFLGRLFTLAAFGLVLAGCPPKQKQLPAEQKAPVEETTDASAEDMYNANDIVIGSEWGTTPALAPVYFATDQDDLTPEARETLKKNAAVLKLVAAQAPSAKVRLEGHCDERGTLEYNLALGQRRANTLRSYYSSLGVAKASLDTISYGEERPVCNSNTEDCWQRNRRGETTLKTDGESIRIPADKLPQ